MKVVSKIIVATVYLLGVAYLFLPTPQVPDLPESTRSNEAGDTWQHPDQKAFYTHKSRAEVLNYMQSQFSVKFLGITIPSYRLNYRPEESFKFVRDQVPSYYLEEIVYPLKASLFVNGWEPKKSPVYKNIDPQYISDLLYEGQTYPSKVTLRPVYSSPWLGLLIWTLLFPSSWLVINSLKKTIKNV